MIFIAGLESVPQGLSITQPVDLAAIQQSKQRTSTTGEAQISPQRPTEDRKGELAMKKGVLWTVMFLTLSSFAQQPAKQKQPPALRSLLLMQLRETHNQKNWFVSEKEAVEGLSPQQAAWSDGKNHSVGQLVAHLVFWNSYNLASFKGEHPKGPADNNETFNFNPQQWQATLKRFDNVMNEWEHTIESADDATLEKLAPLVAHISAHNAYHIGEMIAVRKAHGMWNSDLGVK
jgi:uncharacterized damage-inducible protein DinB